MAKPEEFALREALKTITERDKRIRQLEHEITRLSSPPGTAFAYTHEGFKPCSDRVNVCPHAAPGPPPPEPPPSPEESLRARCTRQRRELRRLNQSQRALALAFENQQHTTSALVRELLDTRAALIVEKALK